MIVGALRVDLMIYDALTLKDKWRVLLSVKQRIRNHFNVSVAEVEHANARQRSTLAVAVVSNERRVVESQLDQVVDLLRRHPQLSLLEYERDFY